jgi:hypothetical protein
MGTLGALRCLPSGGVDVAPHLASGPIIVRCLCHIHVDEDMTRYFLSFVDDESNLLPPRPSFSHGLLEKERLAAL